jgi:FAD/FMN-containing dehydrogenase
LREARAAQCGQTVGAALVIDHSKHLSGITGFDRDALSVTVEPGIVLDQLNAQARRTGCGFQSMSARRRRPRSAAWQATTRAARSIAYGNMVHNVHAIDAILSDGTEARFDRGAMGRCPRASAELLRGLDAIGAERTEIERSVPKVMRRVGGYNIDVFNPQSERPYNTEGDVNCATPQSAAGTRVDARIALRVARCGAAHAASSTSDALPGDGMRARTWWVFGRRRSVGRPSMIGLARGNPAFRAVIDRAVIGEPDAILLVEFTEETRDAAIARLRDLVERMGDLGLPGSVVEMTDPTAQKALWDVRKAGLNIMMSLKGDGKPVSFIEDCAVRSRILPNTSNACRPRSSRHGARHVVRACVGRHAPCAPYSRHAARRGRQDARDCGGSKRAGARIQGRVLGRAAMASCAPSGSDGNSARGSPKPSKRSRTCSTRPVS